MWLFGINKKDGVFFSVSDPFRTHVTTKLSIKQRAFNMEIAKRWSKGFMHFLAGCDMHGQNEVNTIVFHSNIECFDNMIVIKFLSTDCNDCRGNQPRENVFGLHDNVLSVFHQNVMAGLWISSFSIHLKSGWQKLAAFRREQKWPQIFCQLRIC